MRVFICAYGSFSVAIPMSSVSSLTLLSDTFIQEKVIEYNSENRNTYISLPLLFDLSRINIRHGIALKNPGEVSCEDAPLEDYTENRTVLLSTEVECEKEIPDEEIYPIPKILNFTRFSGLFSGIKLSHSQNSVSFVNDFENLILLLNLEQLIHQTERVTV
jgi:hypothetical protein